MKYILVLIVVSILAGCIDQQSSVISGKPVTDYISLVDNLTAAKLNVTQEGEISQTFFSVEGRIIKVNGEDIQVFEYANIADADADSSLVSPDGSSVGTNMITWISTPHFFKKEKLIVIYIGENNNIMNGLEKALGKQFAGQ